MFRIISCMLILALGFMAVPAMAEGDALLPQAPPTGWPQEGPFGTYDRAALQRGFQVYKQVCSVCHSIKLLAYRDLGALGFSEAEVKALAAEATVHDGPNDNG